MPGFSNLPEMIGGPTFPTSFCAEEIPDLIILEQFDRFQDLLTIPYFTKMVLAEDDLNLLAQSNGTTIDDARIPD